MRAVLASGRLPGAAGRVVQATLSGILLGIFSEARLRELDEHYYRCDHMYRSTAWNERGLDPWEGDAIHRSFKPGSKIAVVACGGGREVLGLLRMGFDAVGFESHPDLCAYAQAFMAQRGYPGRIMPMDRDHFPPHVSCRWHPGRLGGVLPHRRERPASQLPATQRTRQLRPKVP